MSVKANSGSAPLNTRAYAPVFSALGDETRLSLVAALSTGKPQSITQLTENAKVSRQAITKHLRILEQVGLVGEERRGRECLFVLKTEPLEKIETFLSRLSKEWDESLSRLKELVET